MPLVVPAAEANLFLAPGVGLIMGHPLAGSCGFALAIAGTQSGDKLRPQKEERGDPLVFDILLIMW